MKLVISVALSCAIVLAAGFAALWYVSSDPSTAELEADLAAVRADLVQAEADAGQYGGALQALVIMRAETLKATEAMLQQKRYSVLRRLNLNYTIEGQIHAPDQAKIAGLEADLLAATVERDRHQAEASLYSGGLIQTVALMNAATAEMTISQLRLALLNERYGLALPASAAPSSPPPMAQEVVGDGEAL